MSTCKGCGNPIVAGEFRAGDDWHLDCHALSSIEQETPTPRRRGQVRQARVSQDIKAPDGYLLGELRQVRKDGNVLFQRGFWQCPMEWAGRSYWQS